MQLREKQNLAIEKYRSFNKCDITKLHKKFIIFEIKPYHSPCWLQLRINKSHEEPTNIHVNKKYQPKVTRNITKSNMSRNLQQKAFTRYKKKILAVSQITIYQKGIDPCPNSKPTPTPTPQKGKRSLLVSQLKLMLLGPRLNKHPSMFFL